MDDSQARLDDASGELEPADAGAIKEELGLADPHSLPLDEMKDEELQARAKEIADFALGAGCGDDQARERVRASVENVGLDVQKKASALSEKLQEPVRTMFSRSEDGGQVAKSLVELKIQVEALDPVNVNLEGNWLSRLIAFLPGMRTPLKRYFSQYESSQSVINAITESLESGREQLNRDNITLAGDQTTLRELARKLERTIVLGQLVDKNLSERLETELEQGDPRRIFVEEQVLFPLRQRILDLQQQLAVSQQGILAIELIARNNKELIRGVNRSLSVTMNALRVAVTVALALADQKLVLEKVQAVGRTTSDLISHTAARLKTQGATIQQQASEAQLDIEALKSAFADVRAALENVAAYRRKALPQMAETILQMESLTAEAKKTIEEREQSPAGIEVLPIEVE